jgi:hypothetical protein
MQCVQAHFGWLRTSFSVCQLQFFEIHGIQRIYNLSRVLLLICIYLCCFDIFFTQPFPNQSTPPSPSLISPPSNQYLKNAPRHHPPPEIKAPRPPPIKDKGNVPSFHGTLILKHTPKGACVGKFRIRQGNKEDFRAPEELIELQGITVGYCGKGYYPANILNILNEQRSKRS